MPMAKSIRLLVRVTNVHLAVILVNHKPDDTSTGRKKYCSLQHKLRVFVTEDPLS
ncbi:MAG: hypothetical protein ACI9XK_004218 [Granulosicoccus sp.]|jgi:hypothetical protein